MAGLPDNFLFTPRLVFARSFGFWRPGRYMKPNFAPALKSSPDGRRIKAVVGSKKRKARNIRAIGRALALSVASLSLAGCFHHDQAAYAEPLPPAVHQPLK